MMEVSVSLVYLVYIIGLHLGMSIGWQSGQAIGERNWRILISQYYIGIAAILLAAAFLVSFTAWETLGLIVLLGFGIGFAYDDKESHPPSGMVEHMINKLSKTRNDIEEGVSQFE